MQELERLSAIVDDDIAASDKPLLHDIAGNPVLRGSWRRYHLIGEVLRRGAADLDAPEFAGRVCKALAAEPTLRVSRRKFTGAGRRRYLRPVAGLAIAASVAALALLGIRPEQPRVAAVPEFAERAATPAAETPVTDGAPTAQEALVWHPAPPPTTPAEDEAFHRRLNSYLVNFNEQRSNLGVPGVHPYVRIVGFEIQPQR